MQTKPADKVSALAETRGGQPPQYGRIDEVQRLFGLARGTIYNLLRSRRIRGCSLQVTGKKSRMRLIDLSSVSALIEAEINQQNKEKTI